MNYKKALAALSGDDGAETKIALLRVDPFNCSKIIVEGFVSHFIAKLYARGKMNVKRLGD